MSYNTMPVTPIVNPYVCMYVSTFELHFSYLIPLTLKNGGSPGIYQPVLHILSSALLYDLVGMYLPAYQNYLPLPSYFIVLYRGLDMIPQTVSMCSCMIG